MHYRADFMTLAEADALFDWTLNLPWQQETFTMFGRHMDVPRLTTWFGNSGLNYRYTGLNHPGSGWPDELKPLLGRVSEAAKTTFNFVLLNRYDHGGHHMGWHRDDEPEAESQIASISLGAARRFRHRRGPGDPSIAVDLEHGSLLTFDGRVQHMLCRTQQPSNVRINLTFRSIKA